MESFRHELRRARCDDLRGVGIVKEEKETGATAQNGECSRTMHGSAAMGSGFELSCFRLFKVEFEFDFDCEKSREGVEGENFFNGRDATRRKSS